MMGCIDIVEDLPDLDEMIEAKNGNTREDRIQGIIERIYEDWDCQLSVILVREYIEREMDKHEAGELADALDDALANDGTAAVIDARDFLRRLASR